MQGPKHVVLVINHCRNFAITDPIKISISNDIFASNSLNSDLSKKKIPNATDISWLNLRTAFQSDVLHNKLLMWKID